MVRPCFNDDISSKARALAESQHLMFDPNQLEELPKYPRIRGGFGTIKVVKFKGSLMALKDLHIDGDQDDQMRFTIVSRHIRRPKSSQAVLGPPFNVAICARAESLGAA
jgi:hypothetical protein